MTLLDLVAWLAAKLHPVVVTLPSPDDGPAWLDYMPAATAAVAAIGVTIAGFALRASRRSADNSAASVEKADAALRGSVRPIVDATLDGYGIALEIQNVGSGVALDVRAVVASVVVGAGSFPLYVGWFEEPTPAPILAAGGAYVLALQPWEDNTERSPLIVLLRCRDVNGVEHWTYRLVGESSLGVQTHVGWGQVYPEHVQRLLHKHEQARASRAREERRQRAEWMAEDAAIPAQEDG